ncbi:MAG: M48 family metalloprotease [Atribacterota bacterium]|nr:M48 family metalloprotease [Atribacterota bacterium]MDD5637387.1 M48 family metalloprotease [Atribacterota bacterium]
MIKGLMLFLRHYHRKNISIKILLIFVLLLIFTGHAYAQRDYEREEKIGRRMAERIEKQYELVAEEETLNKVQQIGEHLKELSGVNEINYQIRIISREGPNAFAFPGGFIYLTADLLDYVHSDDELAAVIAHEMGHIIHQHSIKQLQDKQKLKLVELLTLLVTGDPTLGILSELTSITLLNAYRREYEEEADYTALELLNKSYYYHPVALLTYFERVSSEHMLKPSIDLGIFQTHPDVSERIKKIKHYLKENSIEIDRRLTTKYLLVRDEYQAEDNMFIAQIFINNEPILFFTGSEEEQLSLKMREVVSNFDRTLRLDLAAYEISLYTDEEGQCTLRIGSEIIVSLSPEEVHFQGLTPQEALKLTRDKIALILWKLKLELPVLLVNE